VLRCKLVARAIEHASFPRSWTLFATLCADVDADRTKIVPEDEGKRDLIKAIDGAGDAEQRRG